MRNKPTVAVSGFSGTAIAEPGSAVANALRYVFKDNITIIALTYHSLSNALFQARLVDQAFIIKPLSTPQNHLSELKRVFKKCSVDIYIPNLELEVKYLGLVINQLIDLNVKVLIPTSAVFELCTKTNLHYFCHEHDILFPRTFVCHNQQELDYYLATITLPCLVKSYLNGVEFVDSLDDCLEAAKTFSCHWQHPVIIQQKITGQEYMVAAVVDQQHRCIKHVVAKKHLVNDYGKSAITITVADSNLDKIVTKTLKKMAWIGPLELEYIKTEAGYYYLFEINPRFPSWVDIATSTHQNLPALLVHYLLGDQLPDLKQQATGQLLIRDVDESAIPLSVFNQFKATGWGDFSQNNKNKISICSDSHQQNNTVIAITGASCHHLPMPGASLASAIRQIVGNDNTIKLIYLAENYQETGCYRSDLFDAVVPWNPKLDLEKLSKSIHTLCQAHNIEVIIPCLDRHVYQLAQLSHQLCAFGIKTLLPEFSQVKKICDYPRFSDAEIVHGFAPHSIIVKNDNDLEQAVERVGYPCFLKILGSDKSCIKMIASRQMLNQAKSMINRIKNNRFIVQTSVAGEHFSVCGLADNCELLSSVAIKSIQSCQVGKIWVASALTEAASRPFIDILEALVNEFQWSGPIEIDCIRDKYTEAIYCIDINPRVPSWIYYLSQINHPLIGQYLSLLLDKKIAQKFENTSQESTLYIRTPRNYQSDIDTMANLILSSES